MKRSALARRMEPIWASLRMPRVPRGYTIGISLMKEYSGLAITEPYSNGVVLISIWEPVLAEADDVVLYVLAHELGHVRGVVERGEDECHDKVWLRRANRIWRHPTFSHAASIPEGMLSPALAEKRACHSLT